MPKNGTREVLSSNWDAYNTYSRWIRLIADLPFRRTLSELRWLIAATSDGILRHRSNKWSVARRAIGPSTQFYSRLVAELPEGSSLAPFLKLPNIAFFRYFGTEQQNVRSDLQYHFTCDAWLFHSRMSISDVLILAGSLKGDRLSPRARNGRAVFESVHRSEAVVYLIVNYADAEEFLQTAQRNIA